MSSSDYQLLDPPRDVRPVDAALDWASRKVDYAAHPAYRPLIDAAGPGARIASSVEFGAKLSLLLAKRLIRYEMIPLHFRKPRNAAAAFGFAKVALSNMFSTRASGAADVADNRILPELKEKGCAVVVIPPDRFDRLERLTEPAFDALVARRAANGDGKRAFDDSRSSLNREQVPEVFAAMEETLAEAGVMAAASAYLDREVRLVDINPQINDPSDSFWRDVFPDIDLEQLPRTAYFHRDASGGDLKAIIYFSDVGPDNGPFGYVVGSNHMAISRFDDLICEANDHNGLSGTTLEARRKFTALPAKLRQKGAYGNDLPDESPMSADIQAGAWAITAPKGAIVLFDTKGTHRGGMVVRGERRVITCVMG